MLVRCWMMSHQMSTSFVRSNPRLIPILVCPTGSIGRLWEFSNLQCGRMLLRLLCDGCERFGFSFVMSALSFAILIGWITLVSIIGRLDRQTDRHGLWRETTPKPNTWQHPSQQLTRWSSGQGDGSASVMANPKQRRQPRQQTKTKTTKQHPTRSGQGRRLQLETCQDKQTAQAQAMPACKHACRQCRHACSAGMQAVQAMQACMQAMQACMQAGNAGMHAGSAGMHAVQACTQACMLEAHAGRAGMQVMHACMQALMQ